MQKITQSDTKMAHIRSEAQITRSEAQITRTETKITRLEAKIIKKNIKTKKNHPLLQKINISTL